MDLQNLPCYLTPPPIQAAPTTRQATLPLLTQKGFTILQWNCDSLGTKIAEVAEFTKSHKVDILLIQESKLRLEDVIRQDREGSGTKFHRGGGLLTYVRTGIAFSSQLSLNSGPVELQQILIPIAHRKDLTLTNIYFPPAKSHYASTTTSPEAAFLPQLATLTGLICGDFNAHHLAWDDYACPESRGMQLFDWMNDNELLILNDGAPMRNSRTTLDSGLSAHSSGPINRGKLLLVYHS